MFVRGPIPDLISAGLVRSAELCPVRTPVSSVMLFSLVSSSSRGTKPCITTLTPACASPRSMPCPIPCVDPARSRWLARQGSAQSLSMRLMSMQVCGNAFLAIVSGCFWTQVNPEMVVCPSSSVKMDHAFRRTVCELLSSSKGQLIRSAKVNRADQQRYRGPLLDHVWEVLHHDHALPKP